MSDRDEDITKFTFASYRALKKTLGEFDAVVECNELAIREFIYNTQRLGEDFIQAQSQKHGVKVNNIILPKFNSRIRQYYILSVMQQFEIFIADFRQEWIEYYSSHQWDNKNNGESSLRWTLRNVNIRIPVRLEQAYNYYRLVRNYMAHTNRDHKKISDLYDSIVDSEEPVLKFCACQDFPSRLEDIGYGDFILATNIVKRIGYLLSVGSKPNNELVARLLYEKASSPNRSALQGMTKLLNSEERFTNALNNYAVTTFGRFSSSDLSEIRAEFRRLLA